MMYLAHDSIYAIARYMLSPVRPSVHLSVRHTGGSVNEYRPALSARELLSTKSTRDYVDIATRS